MLTDNEIIKALECCKSNINLCNSCPIDQEKKDDCTCGMFVAECAISLINRQKAEIERLTKENEMVVYTKSNGWGYISFLEFIKNQRAEAIKVFAECVKKHQVMLFNEIYSVKGFADAIDNLVKEMVGDGDG